MSESKQRWRLVFARDDDARFLSHLDAVHLWERAFRRGEIPVAESEGFSPRPRLIFAAPLQLGLLAEHELADLFLAERLTQSDLRRRLVEGMPRGYRLIDLHDVWVGASALATQLVAADYRLDLLGTGPDPLDRAAAALIAAPALRREKRREKKVIAYDLRPLLLELKVVEAAPVGSEAAVTDLPAAGLWMRLRHSQDQGSGRPEEVVAAIAQELGLALVSPLGAAEEAATEAATPIDPSVDRPAGRASEPSSASAIAAPGQPPLEIVRPVRERLWLADELAG